VPALERLPNDLRDCALELIANDLDEMGPDELYQWNLGRTLARLDLDGYEPPRFDDASGATPSAAAGDRDACHYRRRVHPRDTVGTVTHTSETGAAPALALRGLVKRFDSKVAVAGVDLDVPTGSFFGLLGPNGAGKTTDSVDGGRAAPSRRRGGRTCWATTSGPTRSRRSGAWVCCRTGCACSTGSTARKLLAYTGPAARHGPRRGGRSRPRPARRARLADAGRTLVVDYSAGMKKKIGLACALLHAPRLWCSTSRSRRSTRCRPRSSATSCTAMSTVVGRSSSPATSWRWWRSSARHIAILSDGAIKAVGPLEQVRAGRDLEDVFVEIVGGRIATGQELSWL
jgi:ABC-2 type transport system ATP-binding protein